MIQKLKFGTDGWRAIIADDYTVDNVARVAKATALWLKKNTDKHEITLGYDCRFGGILFSETVIKVVTQEGIKVFFDKNFVSTPMISLAAFNLKCPLGIIITASHNPPSYNGFKLKAHYGGPATPAVIQAVEDMIPDECIVPNISLDEIEKNGLLIYQDFEEMYYQHVLKGFDMQMINNSGIKIAYDAMYGAGQRVFKRLVPGARHLHCEYNPSFYGQAPEPIHKNLLELSNLIKQSGDIALGIANDGDADRIGLYDNKGNFIDAHHILLLLIHVLYKYKGLRGKVVVAFSASPKIKKMCAAYGIDVEITKIGFKYISEIMITSDVLVGGEESGGIAVKGHIPERDGIWDALVILEYMAQSGKTIEDLIKEVYDVVGAFSYNRNDLHLTEEVKNKIVSNCTNGVYKNFGSYTIENIENIDGYKYYLPNECNVMIRASGTEPVLRVYAEAPTMDEVNKILEETKQTLLA
jgi:phosphomannomutase